MSERELGWCMSQELWQKVTLCDLLHGRILRLHAGELLIRGLEFERLGLLEAAAHQLTIAAHAEWVASICEQGRVAHGQRNNRCGRPEE